MPLNTFLSSSMNSSRGHAMDLSAFTNTNAYSALRTNRGSLSSSSSPPFSVRGSGDEEEEDGSLHIAITDLDEQLDDVCQDNDQPLDFSMKTLDKTTGTKRRTPPDSPHDYLAQNFNQYQAQLQQNPLTLLSPSLSAMSSALPSTPSPSAHLPPVGLSNMSAYALSASLVATGSPLATTFLNPHNRMLMQSILRNEYPFANLAEPSSPEALSSCSSNSSVSSLSSSSSSCSSFAYHNVRNANPPPAYHSAHQTISYPLLSRSQILGSQSNPMSNLVLPNSRPSVIVSTSGNRSRSSSTRGEDQVDSLVKKSRLSGEGSRSSSASIDEHFRRSLGSSYSELLVQKSEHGKSITSESAVSVDDHFAKALGDTWYKLKKDSVIS